MNISDLDLKTRRRLFPDLDKPKPKIRLASEGEELFVFQCRARKLPMFKREHKFALSKGRGWRFDFAWPEFMVATEIEGLVCRYIDGVPYALGRHCTFTGFEEDCRKYATANELGWHVLRFNQNLVSNWTAVDMTIDVLRSRGWRP